MGETVKLTADDGHSFDAYVARPAAQPKAGPMPGLMRSKRAGATAR